MNINRLSNDILTIYCIWCTGCIHGISINGIGCTYSVSIIGMYRWHWFLLLLQLIVVCIIHVPLRYREIKPQRWFAKPEPISGFQTIADMFIITPQQKAVWLRSRNRIFLEKQTTFRFENSLWLEKFLIITVYLLTRFSTSGGYYKNMDFPGSMGSVNHGGFDIGGFTGTGYKCHAIG